MKYLIKLLLIFGFNYLGFYSPIKAIDNYPNLSKPTVILSYYNKDVIDYLEEQLKMEQKSYSGITISKKISYGFYKRKKTVI